ncbi:cysteine desulfurase family protein [Halalkalibaculum roseum]|uniref:cysteine desulfurase family protein n=1 Tax=Halalkalibaculum roseum TaxID=2709311 RepID=UPI0031FCA4AF
MKKIYLDYNATTPVDPRVMEHMLPYFTEKFGNASSINHAYGWDAEEAVSIARDQLARLIGSKPSEIIFTSGATEAVNLALIGACRANAEKGDHIITCVTEHKAVLDTCHELEERGIEVSYLEVDASGAIDLEELKNAITGRTILVSLMHANNETGVIHPLKEIAEITREHDALLMTDATQSVGKISVDVEKLGVDLAAFSAHKLYGPKGAGALYVRQEPKAEISPVQFGGGQEKGLRPGTLNVPAIVGFGKACELCATEMEEDAKRLSQWRDRLEEELLALGDVRVNGKKSMRLPHMTNLSFEHIDGSKLLRSLRNLAVSQGSACTSGTVEPSHVLKGMGHSDELALSSLRIGLGRYTEEEEITIAIDTIKESIDRLRLATS